MKTRQELYEQYGDSLIGKEIILFDKASVDDPIFGWMLHKVNVVGSEIYFEITNNSGRSAINLPRYYLVDIKTAGIDEDIDNIINNTYNIGGAL